MKIEVDSCKTILFNEIEEGEVFKHNGNHFLKIPHIRGNVLCYESSGIDADYNAVYISSGSPIYFSDNTVVIKVDAKLIVNI